MHQIQDAKVQSRKEADDLLQETEPVRLFSLALCSQSPTEKLGSPRHRGGAYSASDTKEELRNKTENERN